MLVVDVVVDVVVVVAVVAVVVVAVVAVVVVDVVISVVVDVVGSRRARLLSSASPAPSLSAPATTRLRDDADTASVYSSSLVETCVDRQSSRFVKSSS